MAFLGPGYPLFFLFLKYAIAFLTAFLILSGVYELSSNSSGNHCKNDINCYSNWAILLSMYNKANDPDSMSTQQWLNFALLILMIVMLQSMRRHKRIITVRCDERDISASDYTILVENIPQSNNIINDIKKLFEEQDPIKNEKGGITPIQVTKINLTYNLKELTQY